MPLVGSPIELIMPPSTSAARGGGLPARAAEVEGGMINSIGLPTTGIDYFFEHQVPD